MIRRKNKKPTVCFVDQDGADAIWSIMKPIALALSKRGWRTVLVASTGMSGRISSLDDPLLESIKISLPERKWKGDYWGRRKKYNSELTKILRSTQPDVIHTNFAIPGIWARRLAKRMGVPFVVSTQHELQRSMSRHLRLGLRVTRGCVDVHTYVSEAVAASFGVRARELSPSGDALSPHVVIRNGVDEEAIEAVVSETTSSVRGRIVTSGRLVPVKGHQRILEAFVQVRAQYPDAKLLIAGSGPEESSLKRLAERLGIASAVSFMGWLPREELWSLVGSAQAAVFASTQEGFGLALAEAALLDTPLVASNIAAFREVLAEDDQAAWWFQPNDTDGLAQALMQALSASSDERDRRVESARCAAKARATQRVMIDQYVQLYDRLAMSLA